MGQRSSDSSYLWNLGPWNWVQWRLWNLARGEGEWEATISPLFHAGLSTKHAVGLLGAASKRIGRALSLRDSHTLHINSQCVWSRKLQGDEHGSGSWRTVKNYRGEKSGQEITAEGNEAEASKQGTGQAGRSWWLRKSSWEGKFPPDCGSSKIFHFQVNCSWTVGAFE